MIVGVALIVSGVALLVWIIAHEVRVWRAVCHRTLNSSSSLTEATKKGGPPSEGPPIHYGGEKLP